jgi:hypothetical protein
MSNNPGVQSAFPIVVFGAVALSIVMSLVFLFTRGSLYDHIGEGGLVPDRESGGGLVGPEPDSPAARAEREQEIRQMVSARSQRMVGRGQPALDIDAEVARLLDAPSGASQDQAALNDEVRQLVIARNERRVRQGLEPVDVDAEVKRTLAELGP